MQPSLHRDRIRASRTAPIRRPDAAASPARQMAIVPRPGASGLGRPDARPQLPRRRRPRRRPPHRRRRPRPPRRATVRPAPLSRGQPRPDGAAAELLRRVVAARGGLEALKCVRSVVAESDTTFMDERGSGSGGHEDQDLRPLSRQVPRRCLHPERSDRADLQRRSGVGKESRRGARDAAAGARRCSGEREARHDSTAHRRGGRTAD